MRKMIVGLLAAILVGCASTGGRSGETERRAVEVMVPGSATDATARVQAAFVDEGLAVTSSQGGVVEARASQGSLTVRYLANIIPTGDSARVVLTAFGTRAAVMGIPAVEAQVTSTLGGAGDVWARLERMGAALAP